MVNIMDLKRWSKTHRNFVTPHIFKVFQKGQYFIEVAYGSGFAGSPSIYGVTVIKSLGEGNFTSSDHPYNDKSRSFTEGKTWQDNEKSALMYARKILGAING